MKQKLLLAFGISSIVVFALMATERAVVKPVLAQVRAALTQNIDEPGRAPFALVGSAPSSNYYSFSVPAGQRYVVENVTAQCFENTPGVLTDISTVGRTNGAAARVSNQPHLYQSNGPNQNIYIGTGTQVLYADPGSSIQVFADDTLAGGGIVGCQFWISGHVISNP